MPLTLTTALLLFTPLPAFAAAPENDNFASATLIDAIPYSDSLDTTEATTEATDPYPSCPAGGATVWYVWTPSEDVTVALSTAGSDFDTVASVWTDIEGSLTEVGCNDDSGGLQSLVPFEATAGETYYFIIGAFGGGSGGLFEVALYAYTPPPAFEISGTLDTAVTHVRTGLGKVTGTVTCSEDGWYTVYGWFTQTSGRHTITTNVYGYGECTAGEQDWVGEIYGESSIVGRATYALSVYGQSTTTGEWGFYDLVGTFIVRGWSGR